MGNFYAFFNDRYEADETTAAEVHTYNAARSLLSELEQHFTGIAIEYELYGQYGETRDPSK